MSAKLFEEVYGMTVLECMKAETVGSIAMHYVKMIVEMTMRFTNTEKKHKLAAAIKHY